MITFRVETDNSVVTTAIVLKIASLTDIKESFQKKFKKKNPGKFISHWIIKKLPKIF